MPHHEESVLIEAPVETVFDAMTDTDRWRRWWPQIQWVKLASGWTVDGALSCRVMGMNLEGAITAYVPNQELGFTTQLPARGRVTQHFRFMPEDGGTRLAATLDASGMAGMLFTSKRLGQELERLKVNVEAGTQA